MRRALAVLAIVVGAAGCPDERQDTVTLYSVTVAPPARTALLVSSETEHTVQMSRGVALAIGCWDTCKGSCVGPSFEVGDPAVAEVRPVFRSSGGYPTWVIVARTAGATTIRVATACAEQTYALTVADGQP